MADDPRFEPSGTIACTIGATKHRLRRPTMGELRDLWQGWELAAIDVDLIDDEATDERDGINERILDESLSPSERAEVKRERAGLQTRLRAEKDAVWARWARRAFDALSDAKLPESDDDLPPWLLSVNAGAEFLKFWRTVPKASGS